MTNCLASLRDKPCVASRATATLVSTTRTRHSAMRSTISSAPSGDCTQNPTRSLMSVIAISQQLAKVANPAMISTASFASLCSSM